MEIYNFEFILNVIISCLVGERGYKSLSNLFLTTDKSTVRKQVKIYEAMGEFG